MKKSIFRDPRYFWFTLIFGLSLCALGLFTGYILRPYIGPTPESTEVVIAPTTAPLDQDQSGNEAVMAYLIEGTRHFKGDPNAPVTIIEFSDFM